MRMRSGRAAAGGLSVTSGQGGDATVASRPLGIIGHASLDRLAELAAALLGARSAQISLLTDVQTIVGSAGLPAAARTATTALSDSLCTVTASSGAPLVVADAEQDERVSTLPPVRSGAVGAYLGVPLVLSDGTTAGALCVFDPDRRAWSPGDVAVLEKLSGWAVTELELAGLAGRFETDRHHWALTAEAAGIGNFDWDLRAGVVEVDRRMKQLFGHDEGRSSVSVASLVDRVHPDDVDRVTAAVDEAVATVGVYAVEYRVLLPGGLQRWVRARGRVLADERGKGVRLIGSVLDSTDEKDADSRAVRVLETMSAAFISLDHDWRLTYVNGQAEHLLGTKREELLGRVMWELYPAAVGSPIEETYRTAVASGQAQTLEAYYPAPLNAWYEIRALPSDEGLAIYFVDVTERREAQELVQLSVDVSDRLAGATDVEESMHELARALVPRLADWTIVSVAAADGRVHDVATWHVDPALRATAETYAATRLQGRTDASVAEEVATTSRPLIVDADAIDAVLPLLRSQDAIEALRALAPESGIVLPLRIGGAQHGALTILRGASRPPLTEREMGVASTIAQRAGLALDNARLYTEQRESAERLTAANRRLRTVAEALQEAMLTDLPQPDHLQLVARYLTASVDEKVGGDWYDAVVLPGGSTMVSIGDVVGHDIHAAAVMGQLRNMLRMVAWDRDEAPSAILERLDHAIGDLRIDTLATVLTLRIEQTRADERAGMRTLRWSSAGHPAPVLLFADGTTMLLEQTSDLLLGFDAGRDRRDNTHDAPPDCTLLLYTDGLIETKDRDIITGQAELLAAMAGRSELPLDELVDAVIGDMVDTEPPDDVAVLAVRFNAEDKPKPTA